MKFNKSFKLEKVITPLMEIQEDSGATDVFYMKKDSLEIIEKKLNFFSEKILKVQCVNDGLVLPERTGECGSFYGGICDSNLKYIDISGRYRDLKHTRLPGAMFGVYDNIKICDINYVNEDVIYVGNFFNHWGHFLLESTTRLWYPIVNNNVKNCKIVFSIQNKTPKDNFLEFLLLCGFKKDNLIYIDKPTKFKSIIVPEASSILGVEYTKEFLIPFDKISKSIKPANIKNIYLSREKFNLRPTRGEDRIAKIFKCNGYKIFYPECLTLKKMVSIMNGAESIAGLSGTNMHNVMFARTNTNVVILRRCKPVFKNNFMVQKMIGEAKKLKSFYIDASYDFLPCEEGPFLVGITQPLLSFFIDSKFNIKKIKNISKDDIKWWLNEWLSKYKEPYYYNILKVYLAEKFPIEEYLLDILKYDLQKYINTGNADVSK